MRWRPWPPPHAPPSCPPPLPQVNHISPFVPILWASGSGAATHTALAPTDPSRGAVVAGPRSVVLGASSAAVRPEADPSGPVGRESDGGVAPLGGGLPPRLFR